MDRKTAISRAKDQLVNDRDANAMLNREGFVRVLPKQDVTATPHSEDGKSPDYVVTFTIENHETGGRRLMAEFQGVKEFAA
jgi:hypothetical protein